jgi:hypothetical protein
VSTPIEAEVFQIRANTAAFAADMDRARTAVRATGADFELSGRRAAGFAREGLGAIGQVSPQVVHLLGDIARNSQTAAVALEAVGLAAAAFAAASTGISIGRQIRDTIEAWGDIVNVSEPPKSFLGFLVDLGNAAELVEDRLRRAAAEQRAFVDARGQIQQTVFDAQRDVLTSSLAQAAALRAALPPGDTVQDLLRQERAIKLGQAAIDQAREEAKARQLATGSEESLAAIREKFAAKRKSIEIDTTLAIVKNQEDAYGREVKAAQDVQSVLDDLAQARLQAQADVATGETRLGDQLRLLTDARLLAVRAETERAIALRREEVRTGLLDWASFEQIRQGLTATASQRIVGILAQEAQSRKALIFSGPVPFAPAGDQAGLASAAQAAAAQAAAARASLNATMVRAPMGGFPGPATPELSRMVDDWVRVVEATERARQAAESYNRELERPRLREGSAVVRDLVEQAQREAEALAEMKRRGLSETDLLTEQIRLTNRLTDQWAALRVEFQNTPAVLDQIDAAERKLDFGGFAQLVQNASTGAAAMNRNLVEVPSAAAAAHQGFSILSTDVLTLATNTGRANLELERMLLLMNAARAGRNAPAPEEVPAE